MSTMLLTISNRAQVGNCRVGPGGTRCSCCAPPPKDNRRVRRAVKRAERAAWKREARYYS